MSQIGGGSLNFRLAIGEMNFSSKSVLDEGPLYILSTLVPNSYASSKAKFK